MHASAPSLAAAIAAMERYSQAKRSTLSRDQEAAVHEIVGRLKRLAADAATLVGINNQLSDSDDLSVEFDPSTDTMTVTGSAGLAMTFKLPRANPDKPIVRRQLGRGAAYSPGSGNTETTGVKALRHKLETGLEAYYYSAHRILKLLQTLPGLKGFKCPKVTIVRNKLVEHPKAGSLYTFGYGSSGPTVKPLQRGRREWNDDGLVPNTVKFGADIESAIQRALQPPVPSRAESSSAI